VGRQRVVAPPPLPPHATNVITPVIATKDSLTIKDLDDEMVVSPPGVNADPTQDEVCTTTMARKEKSSSLSSLSSKLVGRQIVVAPPPLPPHAANVVISVVATKGFLTIEDLDNEMTVSPPGVDEDPARDEVIAQ